VVSVAKPSLKIPRPRPAVLPAKRRVWIGGRWRSIPAAPREELPSKAKGPLLVTDYGSTTLVPDGWSVARDSAGSIILRRAG